MGWVGLPHPHQDLVRLIPSGNGLENALGQSFQKRKLLLQNHLFHQTIECSVIDGLGEIVTGSGLAEVKVDLHIHLKYLAQLSLSIGGPMMGIERHILKTNDTHHRPL
jgi:hypothetical protein